jgi:indole-3-glycerol phosphate synthase
MLERIAAEKRARIGVLKRERPLAELKELLSGAEPVRPFAEALVKPGISVIAEVKKASPSRGDFNLETPVEELAARYGAGGARAVSVLTEEAFFKGSSADLQAVRRAVDLPVLRKDFIIDAYQLYESRVLPADAVLLIAGLLPEKTLKRYLEICGELGLAAVVEVHEAGEVAAALRAGAKILGINNRDLRTFRTDVRHTLHLAGLVPEGIILVSESGISRAEDVRKLAGAGVDAVLVGEALVLAADPAAKIRELLGGSV